MAQRCTDWHDTDLNHQTIVRQTDTLATRPKLTAVQRIFGTSS
jgi:hypothetical protein